MLILKTSYPRRLFVYGSDNMEILTYPKNIDEINKTKDLVDGFIIGIKI